MDISQLQVRVEFTERPWWTWWYAVPYHLRQHYRMIRRQEGRFFSLLGAAYLAAHKVEVKSA